MKPNLIRTLLSLWSASALACSHSEQPSHVRLLRIEPDLSIGGGDGGPGSLGDIRSIAVDHQGRIYVLEAQAQEVRVFDSGGTWLRTVGRSGSGPGEFRMANGIALGPDERLWVYDPGNGRVSIFDSSGTLDRSYPFQVTSYGYVWLGGVDAEGHLVDKIDIPDGDSTIPAIGRLDLERGRADTLPMPRCEVPSLPPYRFPQGGMQVPYGGGPYVRLDAKGFVWCGDNRLVNLHRYRWGDTVSKRSFAAPSTPAVVSQAERDSAIAGVVAFMKRAGNATPDYGLIPATKPVLHRVDTDDQGNVWVQVEVTEGHKALVFDSLGALISQAALPFHSSPWLPTLIRGDRLYAVTRDSLDLPSVSRFRIR
jgi:hypothetical protein